MFAKFKHLFAELALVRRYREKSVGRLPLSIRFGFERNRIRHAAHRDWPGGYVESQRYGYTYIPRDVDLMAARRLLKPGEDMHWLRHWAPPGSVVIDIGANIGDWSLPAAAAVGPSGRVLAVEPIPRMADALRKTFGVNRILHASVAETAVSDEPGRVRFSIERGNSGGSRIGDHAQAHDTIEVAVTTIDDLVRQEALSRVDFIKIDVEGHEPKVLAGARETLARWKPLLFVETGQEGDEGRRQIANLLQEIGYQLAGYLVDGGILETSWDEYVNATGRCAEAGINNLVFYCAPASSSGPN